MADDTPAWLARNAATVRLFDIGRVTFAAKLMMGPKTGCGGSVVVEPLPLMNVGVEAI